METTWGNSVFREHHKYYGDLDYAENGACGVVSSGKYIAFSSKERIGLLSTNFSTGITEKLASGRKSEYGSKVYTTSSMGSIPMSNAPNCMYFSPFNDEHLFVADSSGVVTLWQLQKSILSLQSDNIMSIENVNATCFEMNTVSSEVLSVGASDGTISLIDLNKNGSIANSLKVSDGAIADLSFSSDNSALRAITKNNELLSFDPRSNELTNTAKLKFEPFTLCDIGNNQVFVSGLDKFYEPVLFTLDCSKFGDDICDNYIFKSQHNHKQCRPFVHFDQYCNLLYVSFQSCADLLVLNISNNFMKECQYHAVDDTFMAMSVLPKHVTKKREICRVVKFSKTRIQQILHTKGGKLIYEKISNKPKESVMSATEYLQEKKAESYDNSKVCSVIDFANFSEEKKRAVSIYLHVAAQETEKDRYFNLNVDQSKSMNPNQFISCNSKYACYPNPTMGGGSLAIIKLKGFGRKKQTNIACHSDKVTTFDICKVNGFEDYIVSGSSDCKAMVFKISEKNNNLMSERTQLIQCPGKVTFVSFHPRMPDVIVICANNSLKECAMVYLYNHKTGKMIKEIEIEAKNICDAKFEPNIGLILAVSSSNGNITLIDIVSGNILSAFQCNEGARDCNVFWLKNEAKYCNLLICVGFGKNSVRQFTVYDTKNCVDSCYSQQCNFSDEMKEVEIENKNDANDDEKEEKVQDRIEAIMYKSFGVSNAVPLAYFDVDTCLLYVSSVGSRKIRSYEISISKNEIREMNASYQAPADIIGLCFQLSQFNDPKSVEIAKCLRLSKSEISPLSYSIPRKRKDYFQDDIYNDTLDIYNNPITDVESVFSGKENIQLNVSAFLKYVSLRPENMELLSQAPKEELTVYQKRRKSQIEALNKEKFKEQPKSTEQAFDQFSRMVADAPTANRWDAQPIGTEVDDDEWDD